jgi:protein TonB
MNGRAEGPVTIGIARQSPTAQQDRLATTLFLAAVLHGMLIAGITFGVDGGIGAAPGLEVLRSADIGPDEPRDEPAAYLADVSQRGSGTTRERVTADLPSAPAPGAAGELDQRSGTGASVEGSADAVLGTTASRLQVRFVAAAPGDSVASAAGDVSLPGLPGPLGASEVRLTARTPTEADGFVADTQSSVVAPYLDEWRRKVERLGTLNYPGIARRLDTRVSPVLAVELGADGRLLRVSIQRSSGQADVDQAALEILRLASPFDPFPRDMARQYPRLRFAYEWRFDRGASRSGEADAAAAYSQP